MRGPPGVLTTIACAPTLTKSFLARSAREFDRARRVESHQRGAGGGDPIAQPVVVIGREARRVEEAHGEEYEADGQDEQPSGQAEAAGRALGVRRDGGARQKGEVGAIAVGTVEQGRESQRRLMNQLHYSTVCDGKKARKPAASARPQFQVLRGFDIFRRPPQSTAIPPFRTLGRRGAVSACEGRRRRCRRGATRSFCQLDVSVTL